MLIGRKIQRREIDEFRIGHDSQSKARILWKNFCRGFEAEIDSSYLSTRYEVRNFTAIYDYYVQGFTDNDDGAYIGPWISRKELSDVRAVRNIYSWWSGRPYIQNMSSALHSFHGRVSAVIYPVRIKMRLLWSKCCCLWSSNIIVQVQTRR